MGRPRWPCALHGGVGDAVVLSNNDVMACCVPARAGGLNERSLRDLARTQCDAAPA